MKCDNCCDIVMPSIKAKMQKRIKARDAMIKYLTDEFYGLHQIPTTEILKLEKSIYNADREETNDTKNNDGKRL